MSNERRVDATGPSKRKHHRTRPRLTRTGLAGAFVLIVLTLACVGLLPWTTANVQSTSGAPPQPAYEAGNLDLVLLPPSWAGHTDDETERVNAWAERGRDTPFLLFGSDRLGRDVLIRCLTGGGVSLSIGIAAALISVVIGTTYGSIAGYVGGRVDAVMMRIVDIVYGLPYILLVVLLAVAMSGLIELAEARVADGATGGLAGLVIENKTILNVVTLLIAIGGVSWLTMARVIRGQVLSLKSQPFMEACRAIGVPVHVQFRRHLFPNLLGPIVVYATLTVPQAILQESFLSFLGIGVQPPLPSWGNLAAEGLSELNPIRSRWWLLLWPCLLLAVTLLSLNFVGEALRASLDPRRARTRA